MIKKPGLIDQSKPVVNTEERGGNDHRMKAVVRYNRVKVMRRNENLMTEAMVKMAMVAEVMVVTEAMVVREATNRDLQTIVSRSRLKLSVMDESS
jgi:hypothetical protein